MEEKWNKETIIALFYYDLPPSQQIQVKYLYDKLNLPHITDLTYTMASVRKHCGMTEAVFRSVILKLDIPVCENYSIELAYKIVKAARRMGVKRINAQKYRLSKGKEAYPITDTNTQKGSS